MKLFLILSAVATMLLSNGECNKKKAVAGNLKGRLEITGICLNYTIKLVKGNLDPSLIATNWTDEVTGKSYTNVFSLKNPCKFPQNLKVGEEFSFIIDSSAANDCMRCEAYYPTPSRSLNIKVVDN
ncbi:MAG: hypothetical protein ABIP79_11140 [Chitinophagaceae bacterium]